VSVAAVALSGDAVGEQVGDRARGAAEEFGQERVDAGEAVLAGGLEGGEGEAGHGLRGARCDPVGDPLLVVGDDPFGGAAGEGGGDLGDVVEGDGVGSGEGDGAVEGAVSGEDAASAASAASARSVQETGPSAGAVMVPVCCQGPRSQSRLWA
jgi:hypothetical protein